MLNRCRPVSSQVLPQPFWRWPGLGQQHPAALREISVNGSFSKTLPFAGGSAGLRWWRAGECAELQGGESFVSMAGRGGFRCGCLRLALPTTSPSPRLGSTLPPAGEFSHETPQPFWRWPRFGHNDGSIPKTGPYGLR